MVEKAGVRARAQESKHKCSNFCKLKSSSSSSGSSADEILRLQKIAGNQVVQSLIKSGILQTESRINQPDNRHEHGNSKKNVSVSKYKACKKREILQRAVEKSSPESREGKQLLAHELVHTIQQAEDHQERTTVSDQILESFDDIYKEAADPLARTAAGRFSTDLPIKKTGTNILQRQADVRKAPSGLPCTLTSERGPDWDLKLNFDVSSSKLSSARSSEIDGFVNDWSARGSLDELRVDGYASTDGPEELNWRISCDRAEAVKTELTRRGIPENKIAVLAHGETSQFSKSSLGPNRCTTISSRAVTPVPSLKGRSFGQITAALSSELPADTVKVWRALAGKGDKKGALRAVIWAMEQRGEINRSLMVTQVSSRSQTCTSADPYILDSTVSGAFTSSCGCFGTPGNLLPNPRIQIHPDLVNRTDIGSQSSLQKEAEVLHSTLLHEFRHVVQLFEDCNASGRSAGTCTDCNDPGEMDAYISEIEAGYSPTAVRRAWVRVFVNWDYLSQNQQKLFKPRKDAAEKKVNSDFPGVNWNTDPEVLRWKQQCIVFSNLTGLSDKDVRGNCEQKIFPK